MEKISSSLSPLEYSNETQQYDISGQQLLRQRVLTQSSFPSSLQVLPMSGREVQQLNSANDYYGYQAVSSQAVPPRSVLSYPGEKALKMMMQSVPHHLSTPLRENNGSGGKTSPPSNTLFVGHLPMLCDEEKLFNLFHHFGEIEVIQLKKGCSELQQKHLSYGFIRFVSHESAARALEEMNGFPFDGRNLRLGWADDHRGSKHQEAEVLPSKRTLPTAQIHVSFIAKNVTQQISELNLRCIFHQFGNVVDVVIKKSNFNQVAGVQSGYGFVHFALTEEGIQSALTAVEVANHQVMQGIAFECTLSHGLHTHLLSLRSHHGSHHGPPLPVSARAMSKPSVFSGDPDRQINHSYPCQIPPPQLSHSSYIQPSNYGPQQTFPYVAGGSLPSGPHDSFPKSGRYSQYPQNYSGNGIISDSRSSFNEDQLRISSFVTSSSSSSSSFPSESFRMY